MKKSRGIISLVLIAAVTVLLGVTAVVGLDGKGMGAARNINLGLDLEGGVSITYQVKGDVPSEADMADTRYKLQRRVEQYSTEATVYQEADNRISIEIPGVTDANRILEELGQPGSLYFIAETGDDGSQSYSYSSATGEYELNKTLEELEENGAIVLTGVDVKAASAESRQGSTGLTENVVSLELNEEGTTKFAEATRKAANKESIGIYYDGAFISVPDVNAVIENGLAEISGRNMTYESASRLASTIRIGGLSVELEEIRSKVVGAQLGQDAIRTSLIAGAIGLAIVFVFMCVVYFLPGFASSIALLIYTGLMLLMLNAFDITLTLPGIAGIILGIGMAVDANVIIFARVREELAAGKSVKLALNTGFQKAMSAILDGNITTLIAAVVLWWRGSGSVRGFAQTLALGIVISMFTALVVTRIIIYAFYAVGLQNVKLYGRPKKERAPIHFVEKRKVFFGISAALILIGFVFMGINGAMGKNALNYSLDFVGGTASTVTFDKDYTLDEIDDEIVPLIEEATGDKNVQVQKIEGTTQVTFKTGVLEVAEREAFNEIMTGQFNVDEANGIETENISATVSSEMRTDAIIAVIISTICILIYIWFRFKDIRFATSAVLALLHDVLVVLGFYAVARVSVGNTFIACMLTIVGYSINATIVIFDRIREELKTKKHTEGLDELVNRSITKTLTRSIYTSFTTFVMVAVLYVMGVSSVKEFALPLMVGIICGAFSSVCITGTLWYVMKKFEKKSDEAPAKAAPVEAAPAKKKKKSKK